MAVIKSSATTFTFEFKIDDRSGDDKAALKLRLSVPFDLAPERARDPRRAGAGVGDRAG